MFEQTLKDFGLTDNESKIYLILLKSGPLNPYQISDKLGLHRGYVYDSLERMQDKGVVSSILINNKKHFQAIDPDNLVQLQRLKLAELERITPELKKLASLEKTDTNVELHKGRHVYQTLIKDVIATAKKGDTILLIGIDEQALNNEIEPIYLKRYFNMIHKNKIKEKLVIKKGANQVKDSNLEYRELEEKYIGNTSQIIYAHKVAVFILGMPYYLIVIENKQVADTYRRQFEALWGLAKPF